MLEKNTPVLVVAIGPDVRGTIMNVRSGEQFGGTIYTIRLEDNKLTPDGLFYARPFEIREA